MEFCKKGLIEPKSQGLLFFIAVVILALSGCPGYDPPDISVTGVILNGTTLSLAVGETKTLTARVTPSNATDKTVSWSTDNSAVATVTNGAVTGVAPGIATITVKTADGGKTKTCAVTTASPDLTIKFGKRTSSSVSLTPSMVSETFTSLHNLIASTTADFTTIINLGDYIDLPTLTIGGSPITDQAIIVDGADKGRLLRLIVVGINSFKRDGAAANNLGAPNHVVFQFQNIPVEHNMNNNDTNVGGYAGSAMKTYLMGDFLAGLKTATGLTDTMLWGPARKVSHGDYPPTATDTFRDTLWLPTEWELFGTCKYSSQMYEVDQGQARLEYYDAIPRGLEKYKYNGSSSGWYWTASPIAWYADSFFSINTDATVTYRSASSVGGCAPAFCVK